jgi:hypothetical protein
MNKINFEPLFNSLKNVSSQISNKAINCVSQDPKKIEEKKMEQISQIHKFNLIMKQLEKLEDSINNPKIKKPKF